MTTATRTREIPSTTTATDPGTLRRIATAMDNDELTATERMILGSALRALAAAEQRIDNLRDMVRPVHVPTHQFNGEEYRWAGSEYHTGVTARIITGSKLIVSRCGKGDHLALDWIDARYHMANVTMGDEVVGRIGDDTQRPHGSGQVFVQFGSDPLDTVHCGDMPSALVALAFAYIN